MSKIWKLWKSEPALLIGALRAILVAAVGFGLNLSTEQITLVILALEAVLSTLTRSAVYAPDTVAALKSANAKKVLKAAKKVVVTDAPLVVAQTLNPVVDTLDPPSATNE
jgi:hypothetical protein